MSASTTSLQDNIFELLESAKNLESSGHSPVEAATKYYQAVYLMHRFIESLPATPEKEPTRRLLQEQIRHYDQKAQKLIAKEIQNGSVDPKDAERNLSNGQQGTSDDSTTPKKDSQRNILPQIQAIIHEIHRLANQANTKLAYALDLDEAGQTSAAIQAYMESAEVYLNTLQVANQPETQDQAITQIRLGIKKRLESTLNRLEQLKNPTRRNPKISVQPSHNRQSSSSSLTKEEISVLKESSMTVSGLFLPWSDADAQVLSEEAIRAAQKGGTPFTDPDGYLKLSEKQEKYFFKWARPSHIVMLRQKNGLTRKRLQNPILVHAITPYTIQQNAVTDCSFVASLCVTAAFERRFKKSLITSCIYPQTKDNQPFVNPLGKYMVKLWNNGVARCVVVDDYLPIDVYGNLLCSHSSSMDSPFLELWVCLIEKAYMKLCGGYNFPGSNSGIDLFCLTGWIPERVHFSKDSDRVRDFEMLPERAWERIASASSFGDCLITVSSHLNLSDSEAERLGLVMGHAYAVLSVVETSTGLRMLQLKNPWAHLGWKGRFSPSDKESWKDARIRAELGYDPDKARLHDDGIFWICWDDILNFFQNFHLSWNPFLFSYRTTVHGLWPRDQGPYDDAFNVGDNPQYILTLSNEAVAKKATVWILISRHVSKQEQEGAEASDFLTIHVHRNQGKNEIIWYSGQSGNCVCTGAYTNNPFNLIRYDLTCNEDKNLSLVLSQYQKKNDLRYTLSIYCTEKFTLSKPRPLLPHSLHRSGHFRADGGPLGSAAMMRNPMIALTVSKANTVVEICASTAKSMALNVVVVPVPRPGDRLDKATGVAVIDSGKYRQGFVVTERTTLLPGSYVVMVSCYTPGQEGPFDLNFMSSQMVDLRTLDGF